MQNCMKLSAKAVQLMPRWQTPMRAISLVPFAKKKSQAPARRNNMQQQHQLSPWYYDDDSIFGNMTDVMRSLDREFDAVRNRMFNNIGRLSQSSGWSNTDITAQDMITTDKEGNRHFEINFDMRGFKPEEIKVKTEEHMLIVNAKKESSGEGDYFLREFSHCYLLPEDLKLEDLKSKWTDDNTLCIEAELPKASLESGQQKERVIEIEHQGGEVGKDKDKEREMEKEKGSKYPSGKKSKENTGPGVSFTGSSSGSNTSGGYGGSSFGNTGTGSGSNTSGSGGYGGSTFGSGTGTGSGCPSSGGTSGSTGTDTGENVPPSS